MTVPGAAGTPPPGSGTGQDTFSVLMVCTGNLHRSPMAERLLAARLAAAGVPRGTVRVASAGTAALVGRPMDAETAAVLTALGGDPAGARSERLSPPLLSQADLVLGAAREHRDAAVRLAPVRALRRAFTLGEFAALLSAEDARGHRDPVLRGQALVRGAAARRGTAEVAPGQYDVPDPVGRAPGEMWQCGLRVAAAVEIVAAALSGVSRAAGRAAAVPGPA